MASKAKDPKFDKWSETWPGTKTLFQFFWNSERTDDGFPDFVRENMTIAEIEQFVATSPERIIL